MVTFSAGSDEGLLQAGAPNPLRDSSLLIIDDDAFTCEVLQELVISWGMRCQSRTEPPCDNDWSGLRNTGLFLLDVHMPKINGLDLIPIITEHVLDAKIIIITGLADKETAIKALRLGAFDFLEKPVQPELLYHSVCRALDARGKEQKLRDLIKELERSQSELLARKDQLEQINSHLLETNKAFSTLARNIDLEREEMEKRIALKVGSFIMPAIEKLRRDKDLAKHSLQLDILQKTLEDLTSGFSMSSKIALALSPTELRVASLIKHGLSTQEVANQLCISSSTVRTHRKSIRRKLKINSVSYNLKNFLSSKADERMDL